MPFFKVIHFIYPYMFSIFHDKNICQAEVILQRHFPVYFCYKTNETNYEPCDSSYHFINSWAYSVTHSFQLFLHLTLQWSNYILICCLFYRSVCSIGKSVCKGNSPWFASTWINTHTVSVHWWCPFCKWKFFKQNLLLRHT